MMYYFIWGSGLTLSLNTFLANITDGLFAAMVSILGGIAGTIAVAWLQHKWQRRK